MKNQQATTVSQIIRKRGGTLIANSKDDLSKAEQISLNRSLKEAELIKDGKLKGLTFDELWDN